jgi:two-component system, NarL family, sensor histidine kinase UhpB
MKHTARVEDGVRPANATGDAKFAGQATGLQEMLQCLGRLHDLASMPAWLGMNDRLVHANPAANALFAAIGRPGALAQPMACLVAMAQAADLERELARAIARPGELQRSRLRLLDGERTSGTEIELCALAIAPDLVMSLCTVADAGSLHPHAMRELEASRRALRRLSANVVEAREEERRRIARELHDELGQSLTAMKIELTDWGARSGCDPKLPPMSMMLQHLDELMHSVRRIASALRPLMLDDLGLGDAIEALANDFSRRQRIAVRLHLEDPGTPVDERISIALYRMVQEALTNVARHAHASEVVITLQRTEGELLLEVRDNGIGVGLRVPQREGQFGVLGMQERAHMLGGRLELRNQVSGGACLRVHLPQSDK